MAEEATKPADLLATAKERYKERLDAFDHNLKAWVEDTKFVKERDQWPEYVKKQRSLPGKERPCLAVDKLKQYVNQVVNDGRQNRPAVKVRPVDSKGDPKAAEMLQGLIRHICQRSNADQAFDTALEHAVVGGFGYFRIITEYAGEKTFNQEIGIKRVRNPLAVLLGPHQEADGSDATFGFVIEDVPKASFKLQYPGAKFADWKNDADKYGSDWCDKESVKVCEYFYRVEKFRTVHMLEDGTCVFAEDYDAALKVSKQPPIAIINDQPATRQIPSWTVKWCRFTGAEILEEKDWLGKFIPIIPVYGDETDLEGKVTYTGLIRPAKDAQRLFNYTRSAWAEKVALSTKAPIMVAEESIDDHPEWKTANTENHPYLPYRAYDDQGRQLPMPQRAPAGDVPAGFAQDMQASEHDIQAALGMYNASLGERSNEKSGKAIMARQREGDTATFHFHDNQSRAIAYMGRQLVDLAPKVYDARRVVRILGEDGTATTASIDSSQPEARRGEGKNAVFNLGVGEYDVVTEAGPSFTTKRVEAAQAMMDVASNNPQVWATHGDLIAESMDWPNADKFAKRFKLMLPPQIQQAMEAEEQNENPDMAAVAARAEQAIQEREQVIQQLQDQLAKQQEALDAKHGEIAVKGQQADTGQYKAETERMQALAPVIDPNAIALVVRQTLMEILQPMMGAGMPHPEPPGLLESSEPPAMEPDTDNQPPPGGFFTPGA